MMQDKAFNDQKLTADLTRELIKERRADRRWKNIRFLLGLFVVMYIGIILFQMNSATVSMGDERKGYVSLVRLDGMIGQGEVFSAETVLPILKSAFSDKEAKGVILDIDSGGGTPVQASIIHDAIVELKKKYHKKVVVVGEDVMASGAYLVAVAGDKIYVNPNTITGSIGVIMKGFGFTDAIKKLGIQRRVITSGINKDRLDPFLPQTPDDVAKIRRVIGEVHHNFIDIVMEGRKGKLRGENSVLFSGDFWSGQSALTLGLVDGLGNLSDVMKKEFNVSSYKDYSQSESLLKSLVGQFGVSLGMALMQQPLLIG